MKCRDLSRIWRPRKPARLLKPPKLKPIMGFDTETIDGRAILIAASDGSCAWVESFEDCVKFLAKSRYYRTLNFFYNLDYDALAVLSHLDRKTLELLHMFGRVSVGDVRVIYIPKKMLGFGLKRRVWRFYDLWQYFRTSLEKAASTYLGEHKMHVDVTRLGDPEYFRRIKTRLVKYCIRDAELCAKLGEYLAKLMAEAGVPFNRPVSAAGISERYFRMRHVFPLVQDEKALQAALWAYYGGRFEVIRRGRFDKVYVYDLNSAYPAVISRLPDLRYGYWTSDWSQEPDAFLGFVKIHCGYQLPVVAPLPQEEKNIVVYPNYRKTEKWITLCEYRFLREHLGLKPKVEDCRLWVPYDLVFPFIEVEKLYKWRRELKREGNELERAVKIVLNGLYGKFLQLNPVWVRVEDETDNPHVVDILEGEYAGTWERKWRAGRIWNPVYGAECTARCRLKVTEAALDNVDIIVAMHTDSVMLTEPKLPNTDELGGWKLSDEGELLIIGSGVYTLHGRKKKRTKMRGFLASERWDWFEAFEANADKRVVEIPYRKAVKLGEWIRQTHALSSACLNVIVERIRRLDINFDRKRRWERAFRSCRDALNSVVDSTPLLWDAQTTLPLA